MAEEKSVVKTEQILEGQRNNLMIGEDTGLDDEAIAVFLFTPDMQNTGEHHHIEMNIEQSKKLHEWLGKFLEQRVIRT